MNENIHVMLSLCMCLHVHLRMYACMYVCIYDLNVCMYVCMYLYSTSGPTAVGNTLRGKESDSPANFMAPDTRATARQTVSIAHACVYAIESITYMCGEACICYMHAHTISDAQTRIFLD
jgi:hypothetical protein